MLVNTYTHHTNWRKPRQQKRETKQANTRAQTSKRAWAGTWMHIRCMRRAEAGYVCIVMFGVLGCQRLTDGPTVEFDGVRSRPPRGVVAMVHANSQYWQTNACQVPSHQPTKQRTCKKNWPTNQANSQPRSEDYMPATDQLATTLIVYLNYLFTIYFVKHSLLLIILSIIIL